MKTIIVPLDFSNESLAGLNLSLMLAHKTGASIQISIPNRWLLILTRMKLIIWSKIYMVAT